MKKLKAVLLEVEIFGLEVPYAPPPGTPYPFPISRFPGKSNAGNHFFHINNLVNPKSYKNKKI